jgi:hypothetical protein
MATNRARKLESTEIFGSVERVATVERVARPRTTPRLIRLERPSIGVSQVAESEVSQLPAWLLESLPRAATLFLRVPGHEGVVAIATSRERAEAERRSAAVVLDPCEWSAIVTAAESDRVWPSDFRALCARKASSREWTIDLETALAGARADGSRGWTVGRVLERLGAQLVGAEC